MEPSFGGINLEDIAAPECFIIEQALRERMNIPVFHDDQHGTAIITAAGLINACLPHRARAQGHQGRRERRRRRGDRLHRADQGDGRAARPCHHVRPQGRDLPGPRAISTSGSRPMRSRPRRARSTRRWTAPTCSSACPRPARSSPRWSRRWPSSRSSSPWPIPIPRSRRPTPRRRGPTRSSPPAARIIPNQVNNVLGFPFIFRGALDVRATTINDEMKIAAAEALAELAREQVPEEVAAAYGGRSHSFGPDYIIPGAVRSAADGDRRLRGRQGGDGSGVAHKPIADMDAYRQQLRARLNPTTSVLSLAYEARAPIPSACCSPKARRTSCCAPRSPSRTAATARRCWSGATTSTTG